VGPDGCVLGGSDRTGLLSRTDGVDVLLDWFERKSEHYSSLLSYLILCSFFFFFFFFFFATVPRDDRYGCLDLVRKWFVKFFTEPFATVPKSLNCGVFCPVGSER